MTGVPIDLRDLTQEGAEAFADVFKAIADPSRLMILSVLATKPQGLTVADIGLGIQGSIAESTIVSRIGILSQYGLVTRSEGVVTINNDALRLVADAIRSLAEPPERTGS